MKSVEVDQSVERIAEGLGRGLSLEDLDGVLLAYSSHQSSADRVRVNFLLSKKVPEDVSAWQLQHGISTAVRPVVVPANVDLGMLGRVCVPLLVRGFRVGYIWVQQNSDEESAAAIVQQLRAVRAELDLLGELLLDSNTAESEYRSRREAEFLAACAGDPGATEDLAGWREVHGRGPWQVAAVLEHDENLPETQDPQASLLTHRTSALRATVGLKAALFSAGTQTHAVVLFSAAPARKDQAEVLRRYRAELDKRSGRAAVRVMLGLSEPMADLRRLPEAYQQARRAVQAAAVDTQLGQLVEYRGTGVYQYLAAGGWNPGAAESVLFTELQEQDRNGELLPVLELIYDKDGSVQDVAAQLHLHRSTVYNRLAKVRSLIGADPLHGQVRLELHLALKARRWSRRPRI